MRRLDLGRTMTAVSSAFEGTVVAACAVAGGLLLSLALGWLLIHVINKQSFGWTLGFALPWGQLGALITLSVAVTGVGMWAVFVSGDLVK